MSTSERDALNDQARAFEQQGRLEDALHCIDQVVGICPDDVTELCNRSLLLVRLSRREEALETLDQALRRAPRRADVLIKRSRLQFQLGRRDAALQSAHQAIAVAPQDLEALNTRGMIYDGLGRRAEARADFDRILSIDPEHAGAITNRGILHGRAGEFREALAHYSRSLTLDPDQPNAVYNRAVVRLVLGDWRQGFREFESRWELFPHEARRLARLAPQWDGRANLTGRTVLLHHEQGFGDTLQFARYAHPLQRLGAEVILAVPAALARLMLSLKGSPRIVTEGASIPKHDYHCALMSLPMVFETTPQSVPADIPYLKAVAEDVERWRARLGDQRRPRIGIAWAGRRFPPINYARDMSLGTLRSLFALDAEFVCLQTDLSDEERRTLAALHHVFVPAESFRDFADTAGLIQNLDLVITVDTATAHLAGALGKPVWVMNRFATCWRWLLERTDSPWYPTLRLFRQPVLDDWASVVKEVLIQAAEFVMQQGSVVANAPSEREDLATLLQRALDLHHAGDFAQAIQVYRRVLSQYPDQFEALHFQGVALAQSCRYEESLRCLDTAIALRPADATAHNHHGNALAGLGRHAEAIASYERAIACDARSVDGYYNQGIARMALGQVEAALECHTRASELEPRHAQAFNNRGVAFSELGRLEEALDDYDRAIQAQPGFIDAWVNRSDALRRLRRFDESLISSDTALRLDSARAEAYNSRGATLADRGAFGPALESYAQAIQRNPASAEAQWNTGLIELARGDFDSGWRRYESRWSVKSLKLTQRFPEIPAWNGQGSIKGKALLLHAEQGYGDTLQFCRYVPELAARGACVKLSVPKDLRALLASLSGVCELVEPLASVSFDHHSPLLSLPLALGTKLESIPAPDRYLAADPALVEQWAERFGKREPLPRIGLVWSGRASHNKDLERSIAFNELKPILSHKACWVSLQKDVRPSDVPALKRERQVLRWGEELGDFADTAALIENLDLLICVDTAVAHLAGALGKPVWIMLPYVPDWRWLLDRKESPWYPSAKLFRQPSFGDWKAVVQNVVEALGQERFASACDPALTVHQPEACARASRAVVE